MVVSVVSSMFSINKRKFTFRLFENAKDSFFVRVQAATDDGPGIISDVVAIERDTKPISVWLNYSTKPDNILDPGENVCSYIKRSN